MIGMKFGNGGLAIRRRREMLKLTQADLAASIGTTARQLDRYETNQAGIPDHRFQQIAEALGVHPVLLGYECVIAGNPKLLGTTSGDLLKQAADQYRTVAPGKIVDSPRRRVEVEILPANKPVKNGKPKARQSRVIA